MIDHEDILRSARITDYNRFYTPSIGQLNDLTFEYEYVQSSCIIPIKEGTCITNIRWRKGKNRDYSNYPNELQRMIQNNEVRARKEMFTAELRRLLEEEKSPLRFVFPDGTDAIILPKLDNTPNKVYVKWNYSDNFYVEQYSLLPKSDLHRKWFSDEWDSSMVGEDWRYLLSLNNPEISDIARNVLYKYFEGIYTGDLVELKKGTELYKKEFYPLSKAERKRLFNEAFQKKVKQKVKLNVEQQEQICIKDPKNDNIIRVQRYFIGPFIKAGWTYATKEEYKKQQKLKFEKRKDMAKDNIEAQMLKYKGPKQPVKPKGVLGNPYETTQTIKVYPTDSKKKRIDTETFKVRIKTPIFEEIPQFVRVYERIYDGIEEVTKVNKKGKSYTFTKPKFKQGKLLWEDMICDSDGFQITKRKLTGFKEEYFTFTRPVYRTRLVRRKSFDYQCKGKDIEQDEIKELIQNSFTIDRRKTIKVLQIPSKKSQEIKKLINIMSSKKSEGVELKPVVRNNRTLYLLHEDRWKKFYRDKVV